MDLNCLFQSILTCQGNGRGKEFFCQQFCHLFLLPELDSMNTDSEGKKIYFKISGLGLYSKYVLCQCSKCVLFTVFTNFMLSCQNLCKTMNAHSLLSPLFSQLPDIDLFVCYQKGNRVQVQLLSSSERQGYKLTNRISQSAENSLSLLNEKDKSCRQKRNQHMVE